MLRTILGTALILTARVAYGQTAADSPTFEVASVKPSDPSPDGRMRIMTRGGPGTTDPGQLTYTNVTLRIVLQQAYEVKSFQISGPSSLDSERFDILAKVPKDATKEQFRIMLQNLLAERFKLTLHHQTKDLPMYALLVGKNGPKLKETPADPPAGATDGKDASPPSAPPNPGLNTKFEMGKDGFPKLPPGMKGGAMMMIMNGRLRMVASGQTMSAFTDMLSNQLDRPVVDLTELKGKYDITLDYAPEEGQTMKGPAGAARPALSAGEVSGSPLPHADDQSGPSLFTAIQEQLGLKLDARKGPIDLLVIDHVEKSPTEN